MTYTSYEVKQRAGLRRHDPQTRAQLGKRLRAMYRSLGLSRADCAKFLHVSERTLHNWESGRHDIPFAAYKLLRLVNGHELPGAGWAGWSFSGGKLWTPEGYGLDPRGAAWWSLLVRRAETGVQALRELARLKAYLSDVRPAGCAGSEPPPAAVPAEPPASSSMMTASRSGRVRVAGRHFPPSPMVITGSTSRVTNSSGRVLP